MELSQAILRPALVTKVKENGIISVESRGLFTQEDTAEQPDIRPFFGLHANTYSQPKMGDWVWVLNILNNPSQLFWIRKDDYITNDKQYIGDENVEIICNRSLSDPDSNEWATIYFSDGAGWVIKRNNSFINIKPDDSILLETPKSNINMRPDGSILLKTPDANRIIDINSSSISLGSESQSTHPAAYGDETQSTLEKIHQLLTKLNTLAGAVGTTAHLQGAFATLPDISASIQKIPSTNVTLE